MNRGKLKNYAPQARREFIQAVTDRAAFFGLTKDKIEPVTVQGDVAIIAGRPFPRAVAEKRRRLEERIRRQGFEQVMEAVAYTWFNRFVAIRYMELHGYLDHGYRVLSHPDATKIAPEIVEHAEHLELRGLDKRRVIELKLDGSKEAELYRMLLIAQCNALHKAMPFLFERIDDETELLLPDNLLHTDSIIRKLVNEIDEADWQQVEIIGWLYQFYISEKKAEVIGKVVRSEDIPAATQLFTPNWIVKYLVQNSLGCQWLATYPDSQLKKKWEYYIEPAEQTPEVQAKLAEITPISLNPEELTLMDPACGSGHILVEAYDLLKDIYLERGYRLRDIPRLILTRNVYGLEIDDRAAQLAAFALMMKARADDRRVFDGDVQPNVLAIQESNGLNVNAIVQAFTEKRVTDESFPTPGEFGFMAAERAPLFAQETKTAPAAADEKVAVDLKALLALFENAKTYGSLITIPPELAKRLPALVQAVEAATVDANLAVQHATRIASGFVTTAMLLAKQYDAVVANPPYMGSGFFNSLLKQYIGRVYSDASGDLYAAFIWRALNALKPSGHFAFITIPTWQFLPAFESLRRRLLEHHTCHSLMDNGRGVWGSDFGSCAFTVGCRHIQGYRGSFLGLSTVRGSTSSLEELQQRFKTHTPLRRTAAQFLDVPGCPLSCYTPESLLELFGRYASLEECAAVRQGIKTGDIERFLRYWHEVRLDNIFFDCRSPRESASDSRRWYPCNKGGDYRKWFGNLDFVLDWQHDGASIKNFKDAAGKQRSRPQNLGFFFREGITWTAITTMGRASFRVSPAGRAFESGGPTVFPNEPGDTMFLLGLLNSGLSGSLLEILSPKISLGEGAIAKLPVPEVSLSIRQDIERSVSDLVAAHKREWQCSEECYGFLRPVLLGDTSHVGALRQVFTENQAARQTEVAAAAQTESRINALLASSLRLEGAFPCEVVLERVTLGHLSAEEECRRLTSFAVGCAMGRYSLDKPGLIYANSANEGFDPGQYTTLPADPDGIIPVTEIDWFPDSAARRFAEFMGVAWPKEHVEENLMFVAESLGAKNGEPPRDTICRYFADEFFKDHLKTYKRRPIYWLFTSGKLGAFQCLVYLHRYNEGTLARMRTEYVIPLQGKIKARIEQLEGDKAKATSAAHRRRVEKEQDTLRKHQAELLKFDENLRHYADLRIKLDLDDGVKVNYAKFGDLLAGVTQVCGKAEDDE